MKNEKLENQETTKSKKSFIKKFWWLFLVIVSIIALALIAIKGESDPKNTKDQKNTKTSIPTSSPTSIPTIPSTSASAITSPPANIEGINNHMEMYGNTDADSNIVTLGPKTVSSQNKESYSGKRGMEFELKSKTPLLAPIDMTLVGFKNLSTENGVGADGKTYSPMNDIELTFESASPDWPGMTIILYHLYTSPLLTGHYQNSECGDVEWGTKNIQAEGHLFYPFDDYIVSSKDNAKACKALIGRTVKRGALVGYAGNVGEHSFASFCFKVPDKSINSTVKQGNRNLHWVQPSAFFYWKSYSKDAIFPSGVLAYPFEIDGYQLPVEQRNVNFKYTANQ